MLYSIRRRFRLILPKINKEVVYYHDLNFIPAVNVKINARIENLNIADIDRIHEVKFLNIERLRNRLERGDKCYVTIYGDKVISYHWVQFSGEHFVQQAGKYMNINYLECYIYHVRVLDKFRGNRVNSYVYSKILEECRSNGFHKVWIYTNFKNIPNRKGLENLGFKIDHIIYSLNLNTRYYQLFKIK